MSVALRVPPAGPRQEHLLMVTAMIVRRARGTTAPYRWERGGQRCREERRLEAATKGGQCMVQQAMDTRLVRQPPRVWKSGDDWLGASEGRKLFVTISAA